MVAAFTDKEIVDPKAVKPEGVCPRPPACARVWVFLACQHGRIPRRALTGWDDEEDGEWSAPTIEHPVLESFKTISGSMYDYRFAFTSAPEVLEKLKCKKAGLFLYRSPKFISKKDGDRPRERFPSDTLSESAVKVRARRVARRRCDARPSRTQGQHARRTVHGVRTLGVVLGPQPAHTALHARRAFVSVDAGAPSATLC